MQTLHAFFGFLPDPVENVVVSVTHLFVGEGWQLTLGAMFMILVIFLPGGVMEGIHRIGRWLQRAAAHPSPPTTTATSAASTN